MTELKFHDFPSRDKTIEPLLGFSVKARAHDNGLILDISGAARDGRTAINSLLLSKHDGSLDLEILVSSIHAGLTSLIEHFRNDK